ncbi:MAG: hypothetical protein NTAFB09_05720 [Nitrosospira sp.]
MGRGATQNRSHRTQPARQGKWRSFIFALFPGFAALPQYGSRYFHDNAQAKKKRANPYVLRREKHQQSPQDNQWKG